MHGVWTRTTTKVLMATVRRALVVVRGRGKVGKVRVLRYPPAKQRRWTFGTSKKQIPRTHPVSRERLFHFLFSPRGGAKGPTSKA